MAKISKGEAQRLVSRDDRVEGMLDEVALLSSRAEYVREITGLWNDAKRRFLSIGRYLNQAKERLAHGEFETMITNDLPFTPPIAYQMRAVAEAVEQGRFRETEIPGSYSIAYQITTLSNEEIREARETGILSPSVKRSDIIAFKKRIRGAKRSSRTAMANDAETEIASLQVERDRLLARLREINDRFMDLGRSEDIVLEVGGVATVDSAAVQVLEDAVD